VTAPQHGEGANSHTDADAMIEIPGAVLVHEIARVHTDARSLSLRKLLASDMEAPHTALAEARSLSKHKLLASDMEAPHTALAEARSLSKHKLLASDMEAPHTALPEVRSLSKRKLLFCGAEASQTATKDGSNFEDMPENTQGKVSDSHWQGVSGEHTAPAAAACAFDMSQGETQNVTESGLDRSRLEHKSDSVVVDALVLIPGHVTVQGEQTPRDSDVMTPEEAGRTQTQANMHDTPGHNWADSESDQHGTTPRVAKVLQPAVLLSADVDITPVDEEEMYQRARAH
jgi:hypothetical protein